MIKLNNKNITYVALADSNNSLKAPKEIWYADSNNSVKLVYRRKDALIEGEDYEKYHWLVAEIPIRTSMQSLPINSANFSFTVIFGQEANITILKGETHEYYVCDNNMQKIRVWGYNGIGDVYRGDVLSNTMIVESTSAELLINNIAIPQYSYPIKYLMFYSSSNSPNDTTLRVSKIYVNGIERYIPCKLLKPVPKWLDANGIRRQIGECGMIDLVSGKFYGNVNSVGTFTVENYYERKEWLKGDGSAYIDTNVTSFSGIICIKFKKSVIDGTRLFGRERRNTSIADYSDRCVFQYSLSGRYVNIYGVNTVGLNSDIENEVLIDITNDIAYGIDGATASGFSITPNLEALSLYLFADHRNNGASDFSSDYIAKFSITNSIDLIPCTLTMDLPASMDANNTPRTKGTSGMWDLVSDRFYGNVANSGTFKAVNLAEGVDYEAHQWLVAEINSVGTLQRLPINSSSMSYRVKRINGVNFHFFRTEGYYDYYYQGTSHIAIYDLNQKNVVYRDLSITDYELDFECSAGNASANGIDIPIYGFPIKEVRFHAADSGGMETCTSSITVDGIERYIPVKLLKSIPSKYDANGIARQAGECGMYDTVNDLFYGNVASSGSFTVEDDN